MFVEPKSIPSSRSSSPNGSSNSSPRPAKRRQRYEKEASIVLIGMRGVGKTTLAIIAGKALGWEIIDADAVFEIRAEQPIYAFVKENGWDAFRLLESQILSDLLKGNKTGKVIACGGGVVEVESNRKLLAEFAEQTGPVIHVLREKDQVLRYLSESTHFPSYISATAVEAWDRREIYYRECCSFEFVSLTVPTDPSNQVVSTIPGSTQTFTVDVTAALKPVEVALLRLLRFIHGVDTNQVTIGPGAPRSYFLSLTFPDVREVVKLMSEIEVGIDVLELRVDLLASLDPTFLAFQIATLKKHSTLPIMYTIRSVSQGGKYPDPTDAAAVEKLAGLFHHALRLGVEYIDLEILLPIATFMNLVSCKGNTMVIGSWHDWKGATSWTGPETRAIFDRMKGLGVDVAKIVNTAKSFEDNMSLRNFAGSIEREGLPLMAINMGVEGKISRVLNATLSPVSHPLLPFKAAPGQISFADSQNILYLTGLLPSKSFYLFGNPISHSMSPLLHTVAFSTLGLPHSFYPHETETIEHLMRDVIAKPEFGGAAVTIPYKRAVLPLLHRVSRHARTIGAVNTIVPIRGGFYGDNTDWRAIQSLVLQNLTPANAVTSSTTALILGAGGTSRAAIYALHQLGVSNIWIVNRTKQKAVDIAQEFESALGPYLKIHILDDLDRPLSIRPMPTIIISTIPATNTDKSDPSIPDLGLRVEHLSPSGGVAMEMAYLPRSTKLLKLAKECEHSGWVAVEGIEVLLEQGYEQLKLWTGRRAPKQIIRRKVLEQYN